MIACVAGAAIVCGRAALQPFAGAPWQSTACDVLGLLRCLLTFVALIWAARRAAKTFPASAAAWWLLAIGAGCWSLADLIWLILALQGSQPWGSAADIFFLLFYPFLLAGILALPRRRPRSGGAWAAVLDVGVILIAAMAAMWILLVGPSLAAGPAPSGVFAEFIAMAYPVGDLLLLWAACDLLFRGRARIGAGVGLLLASGAMTLIIADVVYAVQILRETYVSGNPLGILWALGLVLIGLAGARQATAPEPLTVEIHDRRMLTAVLAAVAMLATWGLLVSEPASRVAQVAAGISVLLVLVRQAHALVVNGRLEDDLRLMNSDLEERVRERTEELASVQQRLAEARRLEAVGRVAGAVAHDFNNILTAVSGHAELARIRSEDPAIHEHLDHVIRAVQRAADLGRRLVSTSRPPVTERRPTDLAAIVGEVAGQIAATLPKEVELAVHSPPDGAQVMADGAQLHQVLMNLCINARDAMPAGGRLGIRVDTDPDWVVVAVSDTGCGMTETVRAHLFEPYFTTKSDGRGNGLGLATAHAIVRQHGGSIEVDTVPGEGSEFRVRLPAG